MAYRGDLGRWSLGGPRLKGGIVGAMRGVILRCGGEVGVYYRELGGLGARERGCKQLVF